MHSVSEIKLTSAEIAALWRAYLSNTMAVCIYKYFIKTIKGKDVNSVLKYALGLAQQNIQTIKDIFNKEGYPIPKGFTNEDVNLNAPPLFSETFVLFNLRFLARIGLDLYSITLPQMARQDMVDFLFSCVKTTAELTKRLIKIKLEKGVYLRAPMIEIPKKIDFIDNKQFISGFFGEKRSLIAGEVTQLFINIEKNFIGKSLLTGFIQVTESKEIKNYLTRGIKIMDKHIEVLSKKLSNENIPIPMPSDTFVTDSTKAPFSDRLIMFKLTIMNSYGFTTYATAASTCMRNDLQTDFIRLNADVANYGIDALKIMIDNGWMEQPPQAINHADLVKV